jgi:phosphatidylglycerophosphatase A
LAGRAPHLGPLPAGGEREGPAQREGEGRQATGPESQLRSRLGLPLGHPAVLLGTWFGAGLLPLAPGTWGSLAALPFAWAIESLLGAAGLAFAAAVVFTLGWWATAIVAKESGLNDPGAIVIDEVAAQWLVLSAAPLDPLAYALGFLLFRIFDIWKPWPVGWADRRLHGGLGIMLDDVLAAVYAALALSALLAVGGAFGVRT